MLTVLAVVGAGLICYGVLLLTDPRAQSSILEWQRTRQRRQFRRGRVAAGAGAVLLVGAIVARLMP